MSSLVWKTRDGREIPIEDMETSHIKNAQALLRRKGFVEKSTFIFYLRVPGTMGEFAQMAYE